VPRMGVMSVNDAPVRAVQIKVSVKPEVAAAFKSACAVNEVSMAATLSDFMSQYSGTVKQKGGYTPNLSTRRQRRATVQAIIHQLERVKDNEEIYRDNIPENLQSSIAFETAEQCLATLEEALDLLASAY